MGGGIQGFGDGDVGRYSHFLLSGKMFLVEARFMYHLSN